MEANVNSKQGALNRPRLKGAIDSGQTRDKVPGFDPGAAPLGTDEESAGARLVHGVGRHTSAKPGAAAEAAADPQGNDRSAYRAKTVWFGRSLWD